jgi:hypothetical protein
VIYAAQAEDRVSCRELSRESAEAKAKQIIREEVERLGWRQSELGGRSKSNPTKSRGSAVASGNDSGRYLAWRTGRTGELGRESTWRNCRTAPGCTGQTSLDIFRTQPLFHVYVLAVALANQQGRFTSPGQRAGTKTGIN